MTPSAENQRFRRLLLLSEIASMLHVLAHIQLHPGKREAFLAEFHRLVPQVRAEQGCIEYGPTVDLATTIPAQQPLGSDAVMVVEKWESLPALMAHLAAPHMTTYRERVKPYVNSVKLQILEAAIAHRDVGD